MAEQPEQPADVTEDNIKTDVPVEESPPDIVESVVVESSSEGAAIVADNAHSEGFSIPRGAIAFAVVMLLGYIFYFFMIWSEVIARGGQ